MTLMVQMFIPNRQALVLPPSRIIDDTSPRVAMDTFKIEDTKFVSKFSSQQVKKKPLRNLKSYIGGEWGPSTFRKSEQVSTEYGQCKDT